VSYIESRKDIEKLRDILLKLVALRSTSKKLMCLCPYPYGREEKRNQIQQLNEEETFR